MKKDVRSNRQEENNKQDNTVRHTRARMMNLTLGNEPDSDYDGRIEERKSEQDEEERDYANEWMNQDHVSGMISLLFQAMNELFYTIL